MSARDLPCGCCEGNDPLTPMPTANRPGLDRLHYRVGVYGAFLETMLARLSSRDYPAFQALTTRDPGDPSIALLDSWAVVADVLTFYSERLVNEGYLRTATERRSVLELARLIGYALRPGVSATVFLAYTVDTTHPGDLALPVGTRAQSVPGGPGELPQVFETADPLTARAIWNNLQPRLVQPQTKATILPAAVDNQPAPQRRVYLQGTATNLRANDALLITFPAQPTQPFRVDGDVVPDDTARRTRVNLRDWDAAGAGGGIAILPGAVDFLGLIKAASIPPASARLLNRRLSQSFAIASDLNVQALSVIEPRVASVLTAAISNANATASAGITVEALRVKSGLFGANLPGKPVYAQQAIGGGEFPPTVTVIDHYDPLPWDQVWNGLKLDPSGNDTQLLKELPLDAEYNQIKLGSHILVDHPDLDDLTRMKQTILTVDGMRTASLSVNGISTRVTILHVAEDWLTTTILNSGQLEGPATFADFVRRTAVYAQTENLPLAEEPIEGDVCLGQSDEIELDGLYSDLQPGRWAIVAGERTDVKDTAGNTVPGIRAAELVMLAGVSQRVKIDPATNQPLPGDKTHTFIRLAQDLAYCYQRDSVRIYGNVVRANHGETRREVLGAGDSSKAMQSFTLKQPPLTYVSANTPAGAASTLRVYVNDVEWRETDSLVVLGPADRRFITKTDDEGKTTVVFGSGEHGARPPTGQENIRAVYRNGIGKPGNVRADQISLALDRPQGVKDVLNPRPATGGADRESRDQARANAPLSVTALDRLVSVRDYADFARMFAGIGKASAARLTDGRRTVVHVTIAGADDIPIDEASDLFRNLRRALRDYGDAFVPVQLAVRERLLIALSANIRLLDGYQWDTVEPKLRAALLDRFGFERRDLGQDVLLSEILSAAQAVRGVAYVDVDALAALTQDRLLANIPTLSGGAKPTPPPVGGVSGPVAVKVATIAPLARLRVEMDRIDPRATTPETRLRPAQIAYLSPDVPDTLVLKLIES